MRQFLVSVFVCCQTKGSPYNLTKKEEHKMHYSDLVTIWYAVMFCTYKTKQAKLAVINVCLYNAPINSKLQHLPAPPRAFELLKIGSFKFPPPLGKNCVQMPYTSARFVCQMPLPKNKSFWWVLELLLSMPVVETNPVCKHPSTVSTMRQFIFPWL